MSTSQHPLLASAVPADVIDKASPIPLHYQLNRFLRGAIESGRVKPHENLPTEQELQDHFDLSRTPVRQAVSQLAADGLVVRRRSRGTVVLPKPFEEDLRSLSSFTEEVARKGLIASAKLIRFGVRAADEDDRRALELSSGASVYEIVRVRYIDEDPVGYLVSHVPVALVPELAAPDFAETGPQQSIYYVLGAIHGLTPVQAVDVFDAASLPDEGASLLGLPAASPILSRNRITYDADYRPLAFERGLYRVRYRIEWGGRSVKNVDSILE